MSPIRSRTTASSTASRRSVELADAAVQLLGEARFALAPGPQRPAADHGALAAATDEIGQDGPRHHLVHLVGHARHRVDDLAADRADETRRRAGHLGDRRGADRDVGLALVVLRHGPAARLEHGADALDDRRVAHQRDTHDVGQHFAGDVVLGGAEPAAADHRVGPFQRLDDRLAHAAEVVADLDLEMRVDAAQGELLADPCRIGVDDLAEQQLGADGNDVATHEAPPPTRRSRVAEHATFRRRAPWPGSPSGP